jgi:hypothetical protein
LIGQLIGAPTRLLPLPPLIAIIVNPANGKMSMLSGTT